MAFFKYIPSMDCVRPISARIADKECRHTDAGAAYKREFVVQALSATDAVDGARRWIACWGDEDQPNVPDDLALQEREYLPSKTYMTLAVLL